MKSDKDLNYCLGSVYSIHILVPIPIELDDLIPTDSTCSVRQPKTFCKK